MRTMSYLTLGMALMASGFLATDGLAGRMRWTHFTIANPLPGFSWGTGGIPLTDYDRDGDLDIFAVEIGSRRLHSHLPVVKRATSDTTGFKVQTALTPAG